MTKALKNQIVGSAVLMVGALGLLALGRMTELASTPTPTPVQVAPVPTPEVEPEAVAKADPLAEWAVRAHDSEQAHEDRCWDQLDERGYGDASCY